MSDNDTKQELKLFLLIAGHSYYPEGGTEDWIGTFSTKEEAEAKVIKAGDVLVEHEMYYRYIIDKIGYDWYCIVDLRDWIK